MNKYYGSSYSMAVVISVPCLNVSNDKREEYVVIAFKYEMHLEGLIFVFTFDFVVFKTLSSWSSTFFSIAKIC